MLFALFVLKSDAENANLIFDIAAIAVLSSILAHGLTDTVGASWVGRRVEEQAPPGHLGEAGLD